MEGSVDAINGVVVFESVLARSESVSGAGRALAAVLMPPPGVGGLFPLELQPPRAVDGLIAARAWREIAQLRVTAKSFQQEVELRRARGHVHPRSAARARCYVQTDWPGSRALPHIVVDPDMWAESASGAGCLWCERLRATLVIMLHRFQLTSTNSQARRTWPAHTVRIDEDGYPHLDRACSATVQAVVKTNRAVAEHLIDVMPLLGVASFKAVLREQRAVLAGGAALAAAAQVDVPHADVDVFVKSQHSLHVLIGGAVRAWRELRANVDTATRGKYARHHADGAERPCDNVYNVTVDCEGRRSRMQIIAYRVVPHRGIPRVDFAYFAAMADDARARVMLQSAGGVTAAFDIGVCAVEWAFHRRPIQGVAELPGQARMSFAALDALHTGKLTFLTVDTTDDRIGKYAAKGFAVHPLALRWRVARIAMRSGALHPFSPATDVSILEEIGGAAMP